jgi:hypothetical protein
MPPREMPFMAGAVVIRARCHNSWTFPLRMQGGVPWAEASTAIAGIGLQMLVCLEGKLCANPAAETWTMLMVAWRGQPEPRPVMSGDLI